MSEYWVSQAKFHCKYCNVWIADNKPTRQLHDGGAKHRMAVEEFHKKKRNEKLFGARSEGEIKQQLAEIERAAREAVAADILEETGLFYQKPTPIVSGQPPPPPPPPRVSVSDEDREARSSSYGSKRERERALDEDNEEPAEIVEDESGAYTVDGQTYLEGPKYENVFTRGMNCEIFVEASDQWYSAVVLGRRDVAVPHTTIVLRTFEISYVMVEEEEEVEKGTLEGEEGKGSDRKDEDKEAEECSEAEGGGLAPSDVISVVPPPPVPPPRASAPLPVPVPAVSAGRESQSDAAPIPAKRVRVSRWDTVAPHIEAAVNAATVPPPPPPIFKFSATAIVGNPDNAAASSSAAAAAVADEISSSPVPQQQEKEQEVDLETEAVVHTVTVAGVRSDHLRLLCDDDGNVRDAKGEVVSTRASRGGEVTPVVASTGFGAWQTVSVRMVDEEEEALLREEEALRAKEEARQGQSGSGSSKYRAVSSTGEAQEEDVMSTFDPYGTNLYKGLRVAADAGHDEEETMAKKGVKVGFKRRRKAGTGSVAEEGSSSSTSCGSLKSSSSSQVHIKIEKNDLDQNTESGASNPYSDIVIKTEIKLEPKTEPGIPSTKMAFGFNGSRKK